MKINSKTIHVFSWYAVPKEATNKKGGVAFETEFSLGAYHTKKERWESISRYFFVEPDCDDCAVYDAISKEDGREMQIVMTEYFINVD